MYEVLFNKTLSMQLPKIGTSNSDRLQREQLREIEGQKLDAKQCYISSLIELKFEITHQS